MIRFFLFFYFILFFGCKDSLMLNNEFEFVNESKTLPVGWSYQSSSPLNFKIDSNIKNQGKYSLSIENSKFYNPPLIIENYYFIDEKTESDKGRSLIELRGYMKTDNVSEGFAGIWLKIEGENEQLAFDIKQQKGTSNWAEYRISLPYSNKVKKVAFGGVLDGIGKIWVDNFKLYINNEPVTRLRHISPKKAQTDTLYSKGSRINEILINSNNVDNLTVLGQFWGFLKYHHPYISNGDVNWDSTLFDLMNKVLKCKSYFELSAVLENYLDTLPKVTGCESCILPQPSKVSLYPNYGELFSEKKLTKTLTNKLKNIQKNRNTKEKYWVKMDKIGYPLFTNERSYEEMIFPDAGYRLLSLFRYWAIINYYYPYRDVIGSNWNDILKDFIPQFILAKDSKEYTLTTLKLIAKIKDSHANIWYKNQILESFKGVYGTPFQAKFIQNKLVVTGFYTDTLAIRDKIKIGDIISSINNEKVEELITKYLPITPGSNYQAQLRDLPRNYLLRSNDREIRFVIVRNERRINVNVPLVSSKFISKNIDYTRDTGYYLINDNIGYVYAGKYKNSELINLKKMFLKTKGIIVDLRSYPSDFMPYSFGSYIKQFSGSFSKFSIQDYSLPGSFILPYSNYNGAEDSISTYKGKVVVLVNSETQSQGEFTAMAFQSSPNVQVVGSQTAGADGNATDIALPGGIYTAISGLGVFYPDSSPTQRVGVRIDKIVKPTIKGVISGKDELLEAAIKILKDKSIN